MQESFEEYRARVLGYLADRDPLRVQAATAHQVARLLQGAPPKSLARRPTPAKWSANEIVAHLADAELAYGWRLRNMIATPGVRLQWWDQDLWSERCRCSTTSAQDSLATFRALRRSNLALVRRLPRGEWESSYGIHDKRGRQTVADFITMEAAHDLNHLRQIKRLLPHSGTSVAGAGTRRPPLRG